MEPYAGSTSNLWVVDQQIGKRTSDSKKENINVVYQYIHREKFRIDHREETPQ